MIGVSSKLISPSTIGLSRLRTIELLNQRPQAPHRLPSITVLGQGRALSQIAAEDANSPTACLLTSYVPKEEPMAEQSPSQLVNDWVTNAEKANPNNAKTIATTIANFYANNAVLCATEGIVQGQSYISADYEAQFTAGWVLKGISNQSINQGTAANWAWACGQWTGTVPNPDSNPPVKEPTTLQLEGCWSILFVNQGTSTQPNWLIQQHTIVTNPVPPDPLAG